MVLYPQNTKKQYFGYKKPQTQELALTSENLAGLFRFFHVSAYSHVFIQQRTSEIQAMAGL